jgi:hypothetical protein
MLFGISPILTIDIDGLNLSSRDKEIAHVINQEVERARQRLINEYPDLIRPPGLLGGEPTHYYAVASWDEIFCMSYDVVEEVSELTGATGKEVIDRALEFKPQNWMAVFWMAQHERVKSDLWRFKLAAALVSNTTVESEMADQKEALRREIFSEHGRQMAQIKHQKSGTLDVKLDILDCLEKYGDTYKNKSAFIRDMLEKYGDKITTPKTIERYLADAPYVVPHWKTRSKKPL